MARLFIAKVEGAASLGDARTLAKSIITSNLVKCAIYGKDANVGRILCAMGYSGAQFTPEETDVTIISEKGTIKLCENGEYTDFSEEEATEILSPSEITALITLKAGNYSATAYGCDLTYDYVKINADYRS